MNMTKIKEAPARVKKFVQDHKVGLAVTATAIPLVALQLRTAKVHNDFLREKGLFDEFYSMDELNEPVSE